MAHLIVDIHKVPLRKIYLDPILGKKFEVCEVTTLDFITIDTKLTIISNPFKLRGWKEFATFRQSTIFINSIHLYLIYFDPCHKLSKSSFAFVFTCCTFVIHSCYKNDNSRIDVIFMKFVNPANVPEGNFTCLYFELQHPPQGHFNYHEFH